MPYAFLIYLMRATCPVHLITPVTPPWQWASEFAEAGAALKTWKVAANLLNKQSLTADKGRSSSLEFGLSPRAGLDAVTKRNHPYPCRESDPGDTTCSSVPILSELPRLHEDVVSFEGINRFSHGETREKKRTQLVAWPR